MGAAANWAILPIVDRNRQLMTSFSEDRIVLEPYADKWRAFGWNVMEINGHDMQELVDAIDTFHRATPIVRQRSSATRSRVTVLISWNATWAGVPDHSTTMSDARWPRWPPTVEGRTESCLRP